MKLKTKSKSLPVLPIDTSAPPNHYSGIQLKVFYTGFLVFLDKNKHRKKATVLFGPYETGD